MGLTSFNLIRRKAAQSQPEKPKVAPAAEEPKAVAEEPKKEEKPQQKKKEKVKDESPKESPEKSGEDLF